MVCFDGSYGIHNGCGFCWQEEEEEREREEELMITQWKKETRNQFERRLTLEQQVNKLEKENRKVQKNLRAAHQEILERENEVIKTKSEMGLVTAELEYTRQRLRVLQSVLDDKEQKLEEALSRTNGFLYYICPSVCL